MGDTSSSKITQKVLHLKHPGCSRYILTD